MHEKQQAQMAIARQRLLTLAFGDMETIRMVSISYIACRPSLIEDQLPNSFPVRSC